jgi:hypothetical protein
MGIPFGYKKKDGNIVRDDGEQEVIKIIRQLNKNGYSLTQIADGLKQRGIRCRCK